MRQVILLEPGRWELRDVPEPTVPPGHALVAIRAIGICGTDLHAVAGRQPFFTYPRVLGHELGVEVLSVPPSI
jgi:threonine dehydrogenase-like Zn-dependent dehydrogenase